MRLLRFFMAFLCLNWADTLKAEDIQIENSGMRLSAAGDGRISIFDKTSNLLWREAEALTSSDDEASTFTHAMSSALPKIQSVKKDGDSIVLTADWNVPLLMRWTLKSEREVGLSIESPTPDKELAAHENQEARLLYPAPFYSAAAQLIAFPDDEGILMDTAQIHPHGDDPRWGWKQSRSLSMPWWGATDCDKGLMTLLETPFHLQSKFLVFQTSDGERALPAIHWIAARGVWGEPREVTFHLTRNGGYVEMAKRFRQWMIDNKLFKTWEEKARDLPQIRKLKGAMDLWIFTMGKDPVSAQDVKNIKALGFDKLLLQNIPGNIKEPYLGFTKEAVEQANAYGYLIGYYHLFSWMYRPKNGEYPEEQVKIAIKDNKGLYESGHNVWGKHILRCPTILGQVLAKQSTIEHNAGFSAFFTDCTIAGDSLRDCYDPNHPLTLPQCAQALRNTIDEVNRTGVITGSERGFWYATKTCAWFEGIETIISCFSRYQGPTAAETHAGPMQNQRPGYQEYFVDCNYGPQNRIPLFQLVFHDSVYCTRRWDDHHTRQPELWRMNDLMAICYGVAPIITFHHQIGPHILNDSFKPYVERYQRTYKDVCGWHDQIGFEEMTNHAFLTKDRKVQQTTFVNGKSVIVNFGQSEYRAADGKSVASMSYLVVDQN